MKAVVRRRWGRPHDVVEIAEVAKPAPADDEVLVRVHASSINRGDYYALGTVAVLMRPLIGGFLRPKDERIGSDFAGIAEAVGKDVTDVQPGDEGYGVSVGAFAEYVSAKKAVAAHGQSRAALAHDPDPPWTQARRGTDPGKAGRSDRLNDGIRPRS
jgi:NADPH:quinone reductase-like Zn-dependent oxidoreductase